MNSRITPRERGLIKGAIRRAFSRSDLRRQAIESSIIAHTDTSRPRVKSWGQCNECKTPTPKSYLIADHIEPVIPVDRSFEEMSLDEVVDRMWCDPKNLQILCESCHHQKSLLENSIRRKNKKEKKNEGSQIVKKSTKTTNARGANKRTGSCRRKKTGRTHYKKTRCNGIKT